MNLKYVMFQNTIGNMNAAQLVMHAQAAQAVATELTMLLPTLVRTELLMLLLTLVRTELLLLLTLVLTTVLAILLMATLTEALALEAGKLI